MTTPISIADRVQRLVDQLMAWQGVVYRQCCVKYATNKDLLSGSGSSLYGGRWNPRGLKAIYASLTPETAMAEALMNFRYYGMNIAAAMPRVFVAIECRFEQVLDLTAGTVRRRLRVSMQRMLADWRKPLEAGKPAVTQLIGQEVSAAEIEAVIVPSAASAGASNIVWFPHNLRSNSRATILGSDMLPG